MKSTHTVRIVLFISTLLMLSILAGGAEPERPPQFTLDTMIIAAGQDSQLVSMVTNTPTLLSDEAITNLNEESHVRIMMAPSITTTANKEGTICVQSELQYFERIDDETFVLKTLPPDSSPGVRVTTTIEQIHQGMVRLDLNVSITTLHDREPISGVSLDVGLPEIACRSIHTQLTLHEGRWYGFGGITTQDVTSGELEHLVIFARVTLVDANAPSHPDSGNWKKGWSTSPSLKPCASQSE